MTELALPSFDPGTVWLVGVGPGDPGLLTLLAAHALKHADVAVSDALVDSRILELTAAPVEMMGKRGGVASPKQAEITARLIELARQGKRVLRLKGGDPFVFGRGPEEAMALRQAGIPFRVVPGITAGIGGLAYAGIPVTSHDTPSVTFVTGHGEDGAMPDFDAKAPTLVFYMGFRHLDRIMDRLLAAGRSSDEPVAVVCRATTPDQSVLETTIGRAVADVTASPLAPPVMVVVGRNVSLRAQLDWWIA